MSESIIKLAAALPKGEGVNGFDDDALAGDLWTAKIEGRSGTPRVAIIVYGVKEAKVDKNGDRVSVVEALRVQPVKTEAGRREVESLLLSEYVAEHGDILPFDVTHVTKPAFADLPRSTDEVDQEEERERENMSPHDELRRHLERVHGRADAHLLTDGEADHRHEADHDGDMPNELQHDREWIGWTRADIEAATADSDEDPHAREDDAQLPLADRGDWDPATDANELAAGDNVRPLFSGTAN